jgi:hypothetical protein
MQSDAVETMNKTIGALVVLVTLLVGILIGVLLAPRIEPSVYAQQKATAPACIASADTECVTPIMTVGSAGIGKLLSNQITTDQLTVNGYDVLKIQNNMLRALISAGIVSQDAAKAIVEDSHPEKYLKFQPMQPSPPSQPVTPPKP